eukprot:COSAG02_NODE_6078_length_3816_cov_6.455172_3_plen_39_part_00
MTGLFTKSKDWHAIHSKWSDRSAKAHTVMSILLLFLTC